MFSFKILKNKFIDINTILNSASFLMFNEIFLYLQFRLPGKFPLLNIIFEKYSVKETRLRIMNMGRIKNSNDCMNETFLCKISDT